MRQALVGLVAMVLVACGGGPSSPPPDIAGQWKGGWTVGSEQYDVTLNITHTSPTRVAFSGTARQVAPQSSSTGLTGEGTVSGAGDIDLVMAWGPPGAAPATYDGERVAPGSIEGSLRGLFAPTATFAVTLTKQP